MAITIYDHPLSPYGQKVKIALLEKGVEFEAPLPAGIGSGSTPDEFISASPRGEVPAFVDGDTRIFDSTVILEYIEDRWPDPPLLPADPYERARARMLEDTMDTHFEAVTWGLAEVRYWGRAEGQLAETIEANAARQVEGWFNWLTQRLAGDAWFNGDSLGWGDIAVVPFVNATLGFGFQPTGALAQWLERVNARPSVATCAAAAREAAFDGPNTSINDLKAALDSGMFKREYRDHRLEWMIKTGGMQVVVEGLEKDNIRFIDVFPGT